MKTILKITIPVLFITVSCTKNIRVSITNGEISGQVKEFDQFGQENKSNIGNAIVIINGTKHKTVTNLEGKYSFTGVKPGTYSLQFLKGGFAVQELQQIVFPDSGILIKNTSIHEKITYQIKDVSLKPHSTITNYLELNLKTGNVEFLKELTILFGKSAEMDILKPESYEHSETVRLISDSKVPFNTEKEFTQELRSPYTQNTTFYAKVYRSSPFFNGYLDMKENKIVITNTTEPYPNTFKIVMP